MPAKRASWRVSKGSGVRMASWRNKHSHTHSCLSRKDNLARICPSERDRSCSPFTSAEESSVVLVSRHVQKCKTPAGFHKNCRCEESAATFQQQKALHPLIRVDLATILSSFSPSPVSEFPPLPAGRFFARDPAFCAQISIVAMVSIPKAIVDQCNLCAGVHQEGA